MQKAPAQPDTAAQAMEAATELRAAGQPRAAIKAQLASMNVSDTTADYLINQADLFAGMMGRPHPQDIDPGIKQQIDASGPMMITESLADQMNEVNSAAPMSRDEALAKAKSMADGGADVDAVSAYLMNSGAPEDEAIQIAEQLVSSNVSGEKPKSKRRLFRRS